MSEDDKANERIQKAVQAEFTTWVLHALPVAFEIVQHDIEIRSNEWTTSVDRVITEEDVVEVAFRIAHEIDRQLIEQFGERHVR